MDDINEGFRDRAKALKDINLKITKKKWTPKHIDEFLKHFEAGGSREDAAKKFGITISSINIYLCRLRYNGTMCIQRKGSS